MGVWDILSSVGDGVKAIAPDLSTVKRAGSATYHYSSAAITKLDQVVRVDGVQYLPDGEARAQIGLFTTKLAKNAANYALDEGFKHIPGATVASKLVSQTMQEMSSENRKDQINMTQPKADLRKPTPQPEVEDMLNVFMRTEFVGNHMFRDLMVPRREEEKKNDL